LNVTTPTIETFDPTIIPYQAQVIRDIYQSYDYSLGAHEVLLSGSVGSAKSILMAHIAIRHCLETPGARVLVGRKAMPDLKSTIFLKILEHLDGRFLKQDRDYWVNSTIASIVFRNGSEIISRSWSDKRYKKPRSLELSMAIIEELTENNEEDKEVYLEIFMRLQRLPHVPHQVIISATNPDSPSHWAYNHFIASASPTRHVYYSSTEDNPFLPKQYIAQLKRDLDPKLALRMIYGQWVEIQGEVIYYQYSHEEQFINASYEIDPKWPILLSWDFNIGEGKPMSLVFCQYDQVNDIFHVFNEVVIHGARTADTIEEADNRGLLKANWNYGVCGDATGSSRNTRSVQSDYDIIRKELSNRSLAFKYMVPSSNPPVRQRHNIMNAYCLNMQKRRRIFVYKDAPTADKGLRLSKLKKGSGYIEDDTPAYQHITTAIGYAVMFTYNSMNRRQQSTTRL